MADLIDRAALFADMERTVIFSGRPGDEGMRNANKIIDRIKAATAVDAVEVVRCRDCKHRVRHKLTYLCKVNGGFIRWGSNGFCCRGERKEKSLRSKPQT